MGLDINTAKGQETAQQELDAAALFEKSFPGVSYIHTPKRKAADYDSVLVKNGSIIAVVAMRCCAKYDLATFQSRAFGNKLLISFHKLLKGVDAARINCVPFTVMIYFPGDRVLLCQRVWEPDAGFRTSFRVEKTKTQATVNGGEAIRDNAYIDMDGAAVLRGESEPESKEPAA